MTQTFAMAPADLRWLWLVAIVPAIAIIVAIVVLGKAITGARNARFELSAEGLRLEGDFYGRLIPVAQLRADEARRVDLADEPGLVPRRRTLGTGMPNYQAGWFQLRNGEKALLYLTDRRRAVYVPTTDGYSVLLSPSDPDGFVAAVRALRR